MDDVLVIGGGAAGMIAAWRAASLGASVRLLEKNPRLGLKIHISGGGKCNITHGGPMEDVRRAFDQPEARFLNASFRRFTNADVLQMMAARGVTVHTRPDGRVFPDSGRADDVVEVFESHARESGVVIETRCAVSRLPVSEGRIEGAMVEGRSYPAKAVIVCVGGSSYPKTGTTGDGYRWMREIGHTIVPLRSALAPMYLRDARAEYSGVALRDCILKARAEGKEVGRWRGDLLFTHHGVSGPNALGVSRAVAVAMERGEATLDIDLLPDHTAEQLSAKLADAAAGGRRTVRSAVTPWLPERLVEELFQRAGVDLGMLAHQLPRKNRNRMADTLKRWELGPVRAVPLERGEVTAGGVALDEVDPQTMASLKIKNLYLAGEILDIAGPVGGYNLQAAFSTGYVAGEAAARAGRE